MNSVNNLMLLRYMRDAFFLKLLRILVHIQLDVFKRKAYRFLYLVQVLYLFNLIVRKLVLFRV